MVKKMLGIACICLYVFLVLLQCLFASSVVHVYLSTLPVVAHFYAFPLVFGSLISVLAVCVCKKLYSKELLVVYVSTVVFVVCSLPVGRSLFERCDDASIRLVEWNVEDQLDEESVKKIFVEYDADVVVLPEFGGMYDDASAKDRLSLLFDDCLIDLDAYEVFTSDVTSFTIAPVTMVVKKSFGRYEVVRLDDRTTFGSLYLKSLDGGVDLIGLHTAPPLPTLMDDWRKDLEFVSELVDRHFDAIVCGDFNATMKHGALSLIESHEDVLSYAPVCKRGTWHSSLPLFASSCIDHVLLPKGKYVVDGVRVETLGGSDHRCVFVELFKSCIRKGREKV